MEGLIYLGAINIGFTTYFVIIFYGLLKKFFVNLNSLSIIPLLRTFLKT